ncbi:MAG: DUF3857 domain-containing protein [Acidobacteriota bacterium]
MRRLFLAATLSVATATPLLAGFSKQQDFRPATAAEREMKGVDYAPGASAAILDWVEVDDDADSFSAEYYRVKIFSDEGKKYADVEVPYVSGYPVNGRITGVSARTIQPDGTIVPFDGKIYDKVLYRAGGIRLRAKTFSLAGVQSGSILEYRYQREWSENLLINTLWTIQREIPVLRAKLSLKPYNTRGEYSSYFTYFNLPDGSLPVFKRDHYELELTNVPVYTAEELAPPEEWLTSRVNFYYTNDAVKGDQFWAAQTARWSKAVDGFIGNPGALTQDAKAMTGKDAMETLRNVYAKAQGLKNLSYENQSTAKEKKNAAEVWAKGEGYRDEIVRAFVAMARAAGLDASVVRVAPRDRIHFSKEIPDAEQMSSELASVTVEGKATYLDPGTPSAPFGVQSWEKTATSAYVLARRGEPSQLVMLQNLRPEDARTQRVADLRLNGETLEGSVTVTFHGQEALRRRLRSWGDDDAARAKAFEDEAKTWFPDGSTVKLTKLTGAAAHDEPVVAKFDVVLANAVSSAGSRTLVPLSVFEATAKNPFAPATRVHHVYFPFPRREEDEVKLTLTPTMAPAALPAPVKLNVGPLTYENESRQSGNEITFKRVMVVDALGIDPKFYEALRTYYSRVTSVDQTPLVLVEKP